MKWIKLIRNEFEEDIVFRLVSIGAISTVTFLFAYIICVDVYEVKPNAASFNVFFSLALSYLASYIFYIFNIFIPKTNEKYRDYTIAAEIFSRIDYNFLHLNNTFGVNAARTHQEVVSVLESIHQPQAITLLTDKTSTLAGYTYLACLSHQERDLLNSYITFLYTTPVPNHYLHLNPFGLPINAIAIHLHGVAIMLDLLLNSTSHIPLTERLKINSIKTMVSDELSKGNELDVLNKAINYNHIKLAIEYTNLYQKLHELYQSDTFPLSIIKLRALLTEKVTTIGTEAFENGTYALLHEANERKSPAIN